MSYEVPNEDQENFEDIKDQILEELKSVEISTEDRNENGDLLIHPDGPVSKLKEKEWKIVRTPSFLKWFGESQVVSSEGEPLVMYHGSKAKERFKEFRTEYDIADQMKTTTPRFKVGSFITKGTHFTDNPEYIQELLGEGKQMYRVFLSIENPMESEENVTTDQLSKEKVEDLRRKGIDGVKTKEGGGVTYVAFESDQILILD